MQGALRRPARSSARSFFVLPLVLALLALAAFPILAYANAPGAVYETEGAAHLPTPSKVEPTKVKEGSTGSKENNAKATGSTAPSESTGKSKPKSEREPEEEESSEKNKSGAGGKGENNGGTPGGNGGKSEVGGQQEVGGGASGGEANKVNAASGESASSSSGGGSSPLVPILIVVVILAAISIGVVLYRQRKDAGGVSSPNAG